MFFLIIFISSNFLFSSNAYPPEGVCLQLPRGPIEYSFHFIGIGKGVWGFKNTGEDRPFLNLDFALFTGWMDG